MSNTEDKKIRLDMFTGLYTADCGAGGCKVWCNTTKKMVLEGQSTAKFMMTIPDRLAELGGAGSLFVIEAAHGATARTRLSKSQPLEDHELFKWWFLFDQNGITIRFFSHYQMKRAQDESGLKKSDKNDPISMARFIVNHPEALANTQKPFLTFEAKPKVRLGWLRNAKGNEICNVGRREKYPLENGIMQWLIANGNELAEKLSPTVASTFGFDVGIYKQKAKSNCKIPTAQAGDLNPYHTDFSLSVVYSVIAYFMDDYGNYRDRAQARLLVQEAAARANLGKLTPKDFYYGETGNEFFGWDTVKRTELHASAYHHKGGVQRSTIYMHGMKTWVANKIIDELMYTKASCNGDKAKEKARGAALRKLKKKRRGQFTKQENKLFIKYRKMYMDDVRDLFFAIGSLMTEQRKEELCNVECA